MRTIPKCVYLGLGVYPFCRCSANGIIMSMRCVDFAWKLLEIEILWRQLRRRATGYLKTRKLSGGAINTLYGLLCARQYSRCREYILCAEHFEKGLLWIQISAALTRIITGLSVNFRTVTKESPHVHPERNRKARIKVMGFSLRRNFAVNSLAVHSTLVFVLQGGLDMITALFCTRQWLKVC